MGAFICFFFFFLNRGNISRSLHTSCRTYYFIRYTVYSAYIIQPTPCVLQLMCHRNTAVGIRWVLLKCMYTYSARARGHYASGVD